VLGRGAISALAVLFIWVVVIVDAGTRWRSPQARTVLNANRGPILEPLGGLALVMACKS
jgi:hypothetical protein